MAWTQLLAGLEIAGSRPEEVTPLEQAFLDAGRDLAEAEERAVRERAAATARQNRRLRWLLAGAAVLLAATLVAGVLAVRARGEAEESATRAETSAVSADARRLAANALNEDRPSLALLQAVEATQREQSPETYGALLTLLTRSPDIVTRFRIPDRLLRVRASADGSAVYLSDNTNRLYAVDAVSGERLWTVESPGGDAQWGIAAVDPRGRWLAVPLIGDPESTAMVVLDPRTGEVLHELTVEDLTRLETEHVPVGGRVGAPVRPEGGADDGDARLRDRPPHRRGAAGDAVRSPRAVQLDAAGRQDCGPDLRREAAPDVLRSPDRTPTGPAVLDRGRQRRRCHHRHLRGRSRPVRSPPPPAP